MISGFIGGAGLKTGLFMGVIRILSSARIRTSVLCTSSTDSSGRMRQLMMAPAFWGSAFVACPPSSIVATQVVRIIPTYLGMAVIRATACGSGGSWVIAFMSAASCPLSSCDILSK